jgi:hypothetical protein
MKTVELSGPNRLGDENYHPSDEHIFTTFVFVLSLSKQRFGPVNLQLLSFNVPSQLSCVRLELKEGVLRSCAHLNLLLLSFNVSECCLAMADSGFLEGGF